MVSIFDMKKNDQSVISIFDMKENYQSVISIFDVKKILGEGKYNLRDST
jgi:hypothetical protein